MTRAEAIKLIDDRMCFGRGKWSEHHMPEIDDYWEAGQMAIKALEEPQWIPWNSGKFPEESGTYTVTAYDGATRRVTYAKYQKRLKRWELTGARAYWRVLAWMPLPEVWRGDAE